MSIRLYCCTNTVGLRILLYSNLTFTDHRQSIAFSTTLPFNSRLRQGFLCLIFYFVDVEFLLFAPIHIRFSICHFAIPFAMLIYLVYLTYCKMCGRLQGYKDTDLASLMTFSYLVAINLLFQCKIDSFLNGCI